jgi:2-dehydropantoate 2-reductase
VRVGIHGAGLIGSYLGLCLASQGVEVLLVVRPGQVGQMRRRAAYPSPARRLVATRPPVETDDPRELAAVDVCLVTVKARDTRAVAETLATVLPPSTPVVSFQNGIRPAEELREYLGATRVAAGVVACNVVERDGDFVRSTAGDLYAARLEGGPGRTLERLSRHFAAAGQRLHLVEDVEPVVLGKLLVNLVNGVAAATGLPLAELLASRDARWLYAAAVEEGLAVVTRLGRRPARVTALPPRWLPHALRLPDPVLRALAPRLSGVVPGARSSTLVDLDRGRPTEIDDLNGAIVALGSTHAVLTPVNSLLTRTVHRIESALRAGEPACFVAAADLKRELVRLRSASPTRVG